MNMNSQPFGIALAFGLLSLYAFLKIMDAANFVQTFLHSVARNRFASIGWNG